MIDLEQIKQKYQPDDDADNWPALDEVADDIDALIAEVERLAGNVVLTLQVIDAHNSLLIPGRVPASTASQIEQMNRNRLVQPSAKCNCGATADMDGIHHAYWCAIAAKDERTHTKGAPRIIG